MARPDLKAEILVRMQGYKRPPSMAALYARFPRDACKDIDDAMGELIKEGTVRTANRVFWVARKLR